MGADYEQPLLPMTGIILAGGKSSRMGRNKAFIEWDGVPLIERSLEVFHSVFSQVLISSNHPELYAKYGVEVVQDNILDRGPLGGLEACLRVAQFEYSFFAACDMPFLDHRVIRFMAERIDRAHILVPDVDGGLHPLHSFYHKDCLTIIEKRLKAQEVKLMDLLQVLPVKYIKEEEFKDFPQIRLCVSNVNTPQEYLRLQQSY